MKRLIFLIISIFIFVQAFAQRKSTTVKSYYRKDGTYVKSHTRGYNSGASSYSSNSYNSDSSSNTSKENIPTTTLNFTSIDQSDYLKSASKYGKGQKISSSNLTIQSDLANDEVENDTIKSHQKSQTDGTIIYLSVLRYKDKTLDICPITRGYSGDWDFKKVQHKFDKIDVSAEEALELISKYGWSISDEKLTKDFSYDYISSKGLPKYITRNVEALKLK